MFLEHFNLKEQPFGVTPDPRFLYLGYGHREALASLYYGIESDRAFTALLAWPGLGKTTLTFQLLEHLQETSRTVFLFQTQCNSKEFFQYLLNGLGADAEGMELVAMHNKLNEILAREMLAGRRFVLAIDEAQNLTPEVLETIRLLSNFETPSDKLIQILLIGQPQLAEKLARPELEQLHQRVSVFAKLEPLSPGETALYIDHRLKVAGYEGKPLFSPGALRVITEQSQGIPRKINALCFSALSLACAMGRNLVDVGMMEEVVSDREVVPTKRAKPAVPAAVAPLAEIPVADTPIPAAPDDAAPALDTTTVMLRQTLSSYGQEKEGRGWVRWALGAVGVAACIAIGIGILSISPGRAGWFSESSSEAWAGIRNAAPSLGNSPSLKSDSVAPSPSLDAQAAEIPGAAPGKTSPASGNSRNDSETDSVVAQPGETLPELALRTLGANDAGTLDAIRKLNPAVAGVDRLAAGQTILLPRIALPVAPAKEMPNPESKN
jgi:general secretion pathway protein A